MSPSQSRLHNRLDNLEVEVDTLKRQIKSLRRQNVFFDHWHNTMKSPWYKSLHWFIKGYRLRALGRWYRAPWNTDAEKYEEKG